MKCEACSREIPDDANLCPYCGDRKRAAQTLDGAEYAAFISYRHLSRDQEVARKVQRAIETFRLPRGAAASIASGGNRLGKCFRDEDELTASHSLPASILEALEKSSALIVICTPEAKESFWVQREIEAFIDMHGRERVFAVLAAGSSDESIPDVLRGVSSADGDQPGAVVNPLAVDMRREAAKRERDEFLRIIAAVAGCGYDDLRQRDRSRRRKRVATGIVSAVAAVCLVGIALWFMWDARQNALIAESKSLAAESQQLFAQGDRYGALEKALEALPESEASADRPVVQEALDALVIALELDQDPKTPWRARYRLTTEDTLGFVADSKGNRYGMDTGTMHASSIAVSRTGNFFAICDDGGNLSIYNLRTGRARTHLPLPKNDELSSGGLVPRRLFATKHCLIISQSANPRFTVCYDVGTGKKLWLAPKEWGFASFADGYSPDFVTMTFPFANGGYFVSLGNVKDMDLMVVSENAMSDKVPSSGTFCNTSGFDIEQNYAAFGNKLFSFNALTYESKEATLACEDAVSIDYHNKKVIVVSVGPHPSYTSSEWSDSYRRYAVEAFDEDLNLVWRTEGVFAAEMLDEDGYVTMVMGTPVILPNKPVDGGIVVSAGREVRMLDPETGDEMYRRTFNQTVVGAWVSSSSNIIQVACADGVVSSLNWTGSGSDPEGDSVRLKLPYQIRGAYIVEDTDETILLVVPANSDNSVVCYRTDFSRGEMISSKYSLDELLEMAHEVLEQGGRE